MNKLINKKYVSIFLIISFFISVFLIQVFYLALINPLSFEYISEFKDDVSIRIEEVLSEKIRPAVAMDGGDIQLKSFKDGVAEVMLKGSCAGCPSSVITLKQGVERMLKHYVPEVNSVTAVNLNE